jgi:uncharacterized protein YdhG (YjbR/CyaY superfamily)
MPAFRYLGRPLVGFAALKKHGSFFPMGHGVLDALGNEVEDLRTAKGTLQFTPDKPMSKSLIMKIIQARIEEIDSKR